MPKSNPPKTELEERLTFRSNHEKEVFELPLWIRNDIATFIEPALNNLNLNDWLINESFYVAKKVRKFTNYNDTSKVYYAFDVKYKALAGWKPEYDTVCKHAGYWWCTERDYSDWGEGKVSELKFFKITRNLDLSDVPVYEGQLECLTVPQTKLVTMTCLYEPIAKENTKTVFLDPTAKRKFKKRRNREFTKLDSVSVFVLTVLESMFLELELSGKLNKSADFFVSVETLFENVYGVNAVKEIGQGTALRNRYTSFIKSMDKLLKLLSYNVIWILAGKSQKEVPYLKSQVIKSSKGKVIGWVFDIANSPWHQLSEKFLSFQFTIDMEHLNPFVNFNDRVAAFTACYLFEYQNDIAMTKLRCRVLFDKAVSELAKLVERYEREHKTKLFDKPNKDLSYCEMSDKLYMKPYNEFFEKALEKCNSYKPRPTDYFMRMKSKFELIHSRLDTALHSNKEDKFRVTWTNINGYSIKRFHVKDEVLDTLFQMFEKDKKVSVWNKLPCGSYEYAPVCKKGILTALGVDFSSTVTWKPDRNLDGKKRKEKNSIRTAYKLLQILSPSSKLPKTIMDVVNSDDIMSALLKAEIEAAHRNFDKLPQEIRDRILLNEQLNENNNKFTIINNDQKISSHVQMKLRALDPRMMCESVSCSSFGRLYSQGLDSYQRLSDKERLDLLIDGKPVAEVDFKCLHCTMIEALYNNTQAQHDIYNQVKWKGGRDQVKKAINVAINASCKKEAVSAIAEALKMDEKTSENLIKAIETGLPNCKNRFFSDTGIEMQWRDSNIILKACTELQKLGYPALPVHDSILTTADGQLKAAAIMEKIYMKEIKGFKIGLSIKSKVNGEIKKNEFTKEEAVKLIQQEL